MVGGREMGVKYRRLLGKNGTVDRYGPNPSVVGEMKMHSDANSATFLTPLVTFPKKHLVTNLGQDFSIVFILFVFYFIR